MKKPAFLTEMGEGNALTTVGAASLIGQVVIKRGSGNTITIGAGAVFSGAITISGHGNTVLLGGNCNFRGDILVKGDNQMVTFGDHSTTKGVYILCQEGRNVSIGKHCMFAREIEVRTTDAHSVIDRATGNRLNMPGSVEIGDHVWVGVGAIVNKGAIVPSDSIVGAMAFVNGQFDEEGIVLAGAPARIVKRGITWNRSRKKRYTQAEMDDWKV